MSIALRDYQADAVRALEDALAGGMRRPAAVLPTGGGKTVVFAHLAQRWHARTGERVLVLAHRDELVRQAAAKLASVAGRPVGVVKAERDETEHDLLVGSVQTLALDGRRSRVGPVGLVVADECHHYTADSFQAVLEALGAPAVGVTATMKRGDGAALGSVWDAVVYEQPLADMIRAGWLCDVRGIHVAVPDLDLSDLKVRGGDYSEAELGERLLESMAPQTVVQAYLEHAGGMPAVLFAPTVASAGAFAEAFVAAGVRAGVVHGGMGPTERRAVLLDFDEGRLDVICNCQILTEGWDSPRAAVCIIARPTASSPLFVQMVGRVLRPHPGKAMALVLDVVGATGKHQLASLTSLSGDGRQVEPKDGQSYLEALDAILETSTVDGVNGYQGATKAAEVDLFGSSRQRWMQTKAGHWFLSCGQRYIVLVPTGTGSWDVAWLVAKGPGGGWIAREAPDLGWAMAHGEGAVTEAEEMYAVKERAWRKKRVGDKALAFARSLKIEGVSADMRAGAVGDMISAVMASRRCDRFVERRSA